MRLRGRKGIRESLEAQKELVILDPKEYKGKWASLFGNDHPIHVEFGMGKGQFISQMSYKNTDVNFIGIDMYDELVRRASEKALHAWSERNIDLPPNLRLALANVEFAEEVFEVGELERVYLNFSDPWPKAKHARRRLTHPRFLEKYVSLLNSNGEIHLKTDSQSLFEFSLNSFADVGLQMSNISLNLHREGIQEWNVMTEYESKFVGKGMDIHRCEVLVGEHSLQRYQEDRLKKYRLQENKPDIES
ncbi:tRNA (guanosine(46)-N7)-methyltransferase TrmB [Paenibacillus crassostreae]|uniref:tRNA (guanine-N(7)-)-methyltransferase n=1 Tax=Paenibacillus crassostreae TaxID=1763538 RepID=A0A167GHA5_9BACL|nr:tRNA (guanosine(46)-N7)-methyltransferase TrmB [Paenibacillus crassostreae]AOZ92113.1 tRNA (guanosine(46)-N7)-methyltransferase TrmB [Paenibacillus crassostreae]OAB77574.1 tRNA (guanine-N7)-methyltransferase [Paenibacillus crassostreae]